MVSNSSWIDKAQSGYLEDLNKFREALGTEYSSSRKNLISSLYDLGLRGGGVTKGMGELGRTYNENIASLGRKESDILTQGQEAKRTLSIQSEIDALTRSYQDALEGATKMRRGAEQQLFDTGAGAEATRLEAETKRLRGQIQNKYGELQQMSLVNPYTGGIAQQAPGLFGQFETSARQGEANISSGRTLSGDISSAILPVLAQMFLPGIGGTIGDFISKIPGLGAVASAVGNLPQIPGIGNVGAMEMATNYLTKRKPEEYLLSKIAESRQKQELQNLVSQGYRQTVSIDKEGNKSYSFVAPEYPAGGKPEKVDYSQAVKQYDIQPISKDLSGKGYAKADIAGIGMRWVKPLNPQNLPQLNATDYKNYDLSVVKKPGYNPVVLQGQKAEDGSFKTVFAKPKTTISETIALTNKAEQSQANQLADSLDALMTNALASGADEKTIRDDLNESLAVTKNNNIRIAVKRYFEPRIKSKFRPTTPY